MSSSACSHRLGRIAASVGATTAGSRSLSCTLTSTSAQPFSSVPRSWPAQPRSHAFFHRTAAVGMPRRRSFFTSSVLLRHDGSDDAAAPRPPPPSPAAPAAKRKLRSAGAKNSLRRVAVIAQQQPRAAPSASPSVSAAAASPASSAPTATAAETSSASKHSTAAQHHAPSARSSSRDRASAAATHAHEEADADGVISAVCVAESFDMGRVMAILQTQGFTLDPDGSGFESHEVVHARKAWPGGADTGTGTAAEAVDLFVFESGTLVVWGLPPDAVDALATDHLVAAAADAFTAAERETETLDFRRDPARDTSVVLRGGDVVVLGTRREAAEGDRLATTRAQIAFSSGLARSTKLAVLERSFTAYFESTRRVPEMLARGQAGGLGHATLSQRFILQKTGELLSLRAQLNHYRELTDALPDIFWDARAELGLEGYYEQVGRALDVGVRIKTLNQKMDYAQEIATVLREISSERHGTRLEWIIIVLIAVEVVFELRRVYLERTPEKAERATPAA